jgi:hypothetical protein
VHLDHVRAEVGEQHRARWAGENLCSVHRMSTTRIAFLNETTLVTSKIRMPRSGGGMPRCGPAGGGGRASSSARDVEMKRT